jgi:hypothetical protein
MPEPILENTVVLLSFLLAFGGSFLRMFRLCKRRNLDWKWPTLLRVGFGGAGWPLLVALLLGTSIRQGAPLVLDRDFFVYTILALSAAASYRTVHDRLQGFKDNTLILAEGLLGAGAYLLFRAMLSLSRSAL